MKKWIKYSSIFGILSLVLVIGLGICISLFDKTDMHLWLNQYHSAAADLFFKYFTYIGEWVPYVVVALLLFYKAGWASFLLADVAISGLLGQGFKYWADTDRPLTYFAEHAPDVQLPLVDGVRMSEFYSFPSGHTTTFFALFMTLTLVAAEYLYTHHRATRWRSVCSVATAVLCFLMAALGGYSRIYLCQHFAEDIAGGTLLGVLTTVLLFPLISRLSNTRFWNWHIPLPTTPLHH